MWFIIFDFCNVYMYCYYYSNSFGMPFWLTAKMGWFLGKIFLPRNIWRWKHNWKIYRSIVSSTRISLTNLSGRKSKSIRGPYSNFIWNIILLDYPALNTFLFFHYVKYKTAKTKKKIIRRNVDQNFEPWSRFLKTYFLSS